MLIFFNELLPATNEELGVYWFKTTRKDDVCITLALSTYENYVDVIITKNNLTFAGISMNDCSEIKVLDHEKKCLEIVHKSREKGRCFLSLLGDSIMDYDETNRVVSE